MSAKHYMVTTIAVLVLLLTGNAVSATNPLAVKGFQSALSACERGLQMETPKSASSLKMLQTLWARYQRNRDLALSLDATLKESKIESYTGKFFVQKTFAETYQTCEDEFARKITQAGIQLTNKASGQKTPKATTEATEITKKLDAAKQQVALAVKYCTEHEHTPTTTASSLLKTYQTAKQKALEIYPDVVKQSYEAMILEVDKNKEVKTTKTIQAWFDYCDTILTHQATPAPVKQKPKNVEEEGPALQPVAPVQPPKPEAPAPVVTPVPTPVTPPSTTQATPTPKPTVTPTKSPQPDGDTGDDTSSPDTGASMDYAKALTIMQDDRLKVLKEQGRLPEFVDDDDNDLKKAKTWQYEAEDGKKCSIYGFKDNKLDGTRTKVIPSECPPFK